MEYFKFKGTKSDNIGIIVKEMPAIAKSEKNIESINVSGRNGAFHIDEGTYKTKKYKIKCVLVDNTYLDQIKTLFDGKGKLELSTESDREYNAVVLNQIDFSKYLTYLREFTLNFELDPISFSKIETTKTITENTSFTGGGNCNVNPKITVTGTGTFALNNIPVVVNETGITIDCELMNCTKNNLNKNDKVNIDTDFPYIKPGTNTVSLGEGITSVSIVYKAGWL